MSLAIIYSLLDGWDSSRTFAGLVNTQYLDFKLDLSIEGMRSHQFSVGVFFFMLLGVLVFCGIIYIVMFGKHAPKTMRLGEKVMFGGIILGVIVAVMFGASQMLYGNLY